MRLPLLATRQAVARALGVADPRSLRSESLKPAAKLVIGRQVRILYLCPTDTLPATVLVDVQGGPITPQLGQTGKLV